MAKPLVARELLGEQYRAFRVQGTFRYTTTHRNLIDGNEDFMIQFRHAHLDHSRLVFVTDSRNMGLSEGRSGWGRILRADQVLAADLGWVIRDATVYQEIHNRSTLGDPLFPMIALPYSYFYANIQGIRAKFPCSASLPDFTGSLQLAMVPLFRRAVPDHLTPWLQHRYPVPMVWCAWWPAPACCICWKTCSTRCMPNGWNSTSSNWCLFSRVLWWLLPALFVVALLPPLVWRPIERRTRYPVPNVARTFVNLVVFGIAGVCILAFVFERPLTTILAASGLLTLILGIALQNLILDAFSGLVLNLSNPSLCRNGSAFAARWHGRQFGRSRN